MQLLTDVQPKTKIILIGNYAKDNQESMERFAQLLKREFSGLGIITVLWRPIIFFGKLTSNTKSGIGKWLGYLDKWILFPIILYCRVRAQNLHGPLIKFHICDHSNSPYVQYLPRENTSITCHDVLAIRGAFGHADAYCPSTPAGKILQKWILRGLQSADRIAITSNLTLQQLQDLTPSSLTLNKNWTVIHNGLNAKFHPIKKSQRDVLLEPLGIKSGDSFILHVGSSLPRKNRILLVDMMKHLGDRWNGRVCFAGQPADSTILRHAASLGLAHRIISVNKPNHETLNALYSACDSFVFPSFSEGFGWPVIEAQACGAPVIASSLAPMPEVSGGAALHADPNKPADFANAYLYLRNDKEFKDELIQKGFENLKRFAPEKMIQDYLRLLEVKVSRNQEI
jgi:glycosyltransferase involved in cell wall biosynthesis